MRSQAGRRTRRIQDEEIKREVETIPVELDNHLPPIERQITEQPNAIEQEQAE